MNDKPELPEIVIPKENAVFWMDARGRWCNQNGPFRHKKIIDYFNAAIRRDDNGFFVTQVRDNVCEKVYFRYENTALFAMDILFKDPVELVLNTGEKTELIPGGLFIRKDDLYMADGELLIKFNERALLKIAEKIVCKQERYFIRVGRCVYPVPER